MIVMMMYPRSEERGKRNRQFAMLFRARIHKMGMYLVGTLTPRSKIIVFRMVR